MPGFRYTPFASLSEEFARRSVTCASPSKAFNLAGVQVANIFAADAGLRERIARSLEINETGMISPFAIEALTAAYTDGAEWLDALNGYLWENYLSCGTTSRGIFRSSRCFRWKGPTSSGPTAGPRGCRPTRSPDGCWTKAACTSTPGPCTAPRAKASSA